MDDFYKKIRDNVNNRPEVPFNESAWTRMQARMQADAVAGAPVPNNDKLKKRWLLLLGLLLLGSVGTNFLFYAQSVKNHSSLLEFNKKHTDTIVKKEVIYHTDTIYITTPSKEQPVRRESTSSSYASRSFSFRALKPSSDPYFGFEQTFTQPNNNADFSTTRRASNQSKPYWQHVINAKLSRLAIDENTRTNQKDIYVNNNPSENPNDLNANLRLMDALFLESLTYKGHTEWDVKKLAYSGELTEVVESKRRKRFTDHLYKMRPKSVILGGKAGWVFPSQEGVLPAKENVYISIEGYEAGIQGDIVFSDQLRLFTSFSYIKTVFRTEQFDESLGVPAKESPDAEYIFEEVIVEMPTLQYSLGFNYYFRTNKKLRPFVGVGLTAISSLKYKLAYEFDKNIDDLELVVDDEISRRDLLTNQLLFNAGFAYQIQDKWSLQFQGSYRYNVNKNGFTPPNIFGLKSGLFYHF